MDIQTYQSNFVRYLENAKDLGKDLKLKPYDEIIIAGMGGSGIAGEIVKILAPDIRITPIKSYNLPKFANEKTLVIAISYSGNTEETLEVYKQARKKKCQIIGITSGGKLRDLCFKEKHTYIKVPYGIQPRDSLPYLLLTILNLLNIKFDVEKLIANITHPKIKQKAMDLAERIQGKIPIIYSSENIFPIAYRWKTQFNENVKIHAFANSFSEFNHNELEGYEKLNGDYYIIILRDYEDSMKMSKRIDVTKKIIMKKDIEVTEINTTGRNIFNRIMVQLYIGDIATIYLANLNETEVSEVKLIEDLKKEL